MTDQSKLAAAHRALAASERSGIDAFIVMDVMRAAAAQEAMTHDGVRPDTIRMLIASP